MFGRMDSDEGVCSDEIFGCISFDDFDTRMPL